MSRNEAILIPAVPQASTILASLGQAAFVWDIATDAIAWSDHAGLGFSGYSGGGAGQRRGIFKADRTGALDPVGRAGPFAAGAARDGAPYRIEYGVRTNTSAPVLWIEESGTWFAGADGKPARVQGIVRINNERHARDEQLVKLSRHDPLTGELNRTHLVASLAEAIEEAARFRSSCAFMLIGIDHLARINDAFGFDVADAVISEVARRIRARLRGGDVLGRFSGNKFGLILKNCTVDDMNVAAERFLAGIRDEVVPTKSGPVSVTASIGAVSVPRYARNADEAINRAQETLDMAKRRRAGSFSLWRPNVERDAQRRVNIRVTDEIVTALNERRIVMAFEPVVEARSRNAAFYECLVRMEQDDGQVLLAPDIVPVAEKLGLIRLVDHRVLELVVAELAASPNVQLSLNISPDTTMDPDWWASIESLMRAHPGVAERLIVEITETVAIQDIDDISGLRHPAEELRQPDRDRRFRRRLHLVPQFAQARRRHREDRRRLRAEHRPLGRRSRLRADADRSGAPAGNQDGRRMGSGRRIRRDAARLGLRLHPGPPDRAGVLAAALGCAGRDGVAGGGLKYHCSLNNRNVVPANAGTHTPCPVVWTMV